MTIREALTRAAALLREASASPALDASLLLTHVLNRNRTHLLAAYAEALPTESETRFFSLVDVRRNGNSVAYIIGHKEFRSLEFFVSPDVLVPRPDTEILVEAALDWLDSRGKASVSILDLCTGTGCVAIALKNERPQHRIAAADVSAAAIKVARHNAQRLLPSGESIDFFTSDLFTSVSGKFNLIVANPPYIPSAVIETLAAEVRGEPKLALDGGADGLALYRRIIPTALGRLEDGGQIFLESGEGLCGQVTRLLQDAGFKELVSINDLAGLPRVVGGTPG